ncbi:NEDD8-activating enzyme E1 regulatory subunit-like [Actinia tenebrosa]|uniref:NEDD8-activating enzyme E1 regulatory subunit n=1 Tax=Actinia tenebrosa TaxID=6105 RepID=A0A6P8HRZ2_ACTTE|nr:NEDD8-activating enzyme E1 regulatory subunit-like [Actinia tenebrosa]
MPKISVEKEKKYDRQLRLWGDHGQLALEKAKICLINASATGTEILKNLILPGMGSFTIIDGNKVSGENIGNNFFLEKDSLGKSRAECATEFLLELNADVSGDFIEEAPERLLENNKEFFKSFAVVIATQLHRSVLLKLAEVLWMYDVPLLVCRSYGFIGYMRLVVREHTVVESHPDSAHEDLRLDRPFRGLKDYVDGLDFDAMSKEEHTHVPCIAILLKYLTKWKMEHDNLPPQNYKEKDLFKKMIRQGIRVRQHGIPEEEENFDEAIKSVNKAFVPTKIPSEVTKIFQEADCSTKIIDSSSSFWILARAVKEFVENEGQGALPLRGSIPDMTADSKSYIFLQNIYQEQAKQDVAAVTQRVHSILSSIGKSADSIPENEIKIFCRNAYFLQVVRCRSLAEEYNPSTANTTEIGSNLEDPDSDVVFYVLMRAVDQFYSQYHRFPGHFDDQVEADVVKLRSCVSALLQEWTLATNIKSEYIHEMCRYGASEIHPIAAFIGGAGAQEVVKLITRQFVPFNNTFIYNGMTGSSKTLQL